MLTLVVDTAGTTGGVLLATSERPGGNQALSEVLGSRDLRAREFSAQLIPAIAELLVSRGLTLPDVDLFAVVSGPGSFTGLRVGISTVKALAEAMAKPVVAVSRLAVTASMLTDAEAEGTVTVHAVLDAGRGEFYHGIYQDAGWTRVQESLETLESLSSSLLHTPGLLITSDASVHTALAALHPRQVAPCEVREALPLVLRNWYAGRTADVLTLDANYLRSSDTEILARLATHALQRKMNDTASMQARVRPEKHPVR